jgi:AICAR transformylase/IMP cyclohydrolase PurH
MPASVCTDGFHPFEDVVRRVVRVMAEAYIRPHKAVILIR